MQPQQSGSLPQGQYDFITNPAKPPKAPLFSNPKRLALVVLGSAVILVILIVIVSSLLGGTSGKEELTATIKQQNTIVALAEEGVKNATTTDTKTLAATTQASLSSDSQQLLSATTARAGKINSKQIAASIDNETQQKLANAQQNSQYDVIFESTLKEYLQSYKSQLQNANAAVSNSTIQALLSTSFDNANLLLGFTEQN